MTEPSTYTYYIGGSLPVSSPTYVTRQADHDLYAGLKAGEYCYVLNSRQMGKSSLRVRTMQRLQAEGVACAAIDITSIGTSDITPGEWYASVIDSIVGSLDLYSTFDLNDWWMHEKILSDVKRFSKFIEDVLLRLVDRPIVIFVDEIDSVLSLPFNIDDFFAVIRDCYSNRADKPNYQRLTFALLGVTTPADLIRDKRRTPFNIGRPIELNGFQLAESQPLAQGLVPYIRQPQAVMAAILDWTGGQPFLTQKLCKLIQSQAADIPAGKEADWVANLVQTHVIQNWESQDTPEHLKTIRDRIIRSAGQRTGRLLGLYQQILDPLQLPWDAGRSSQPFHTGQASGIPADDSSEQMELRLSGLVVKRWGQLQVYNRIYETVFDRAWVEAELARLRPYAEAFAAWVESGGQDNSRLLRGQALADAQAWAANKSLSDQDYRFLDASREQDNRQLKLQAQTYQASYQQAEQQLKRALIYQKPKPRTVLWASVSVAAAVLVVRFLGLLQPLELAAFDQLLRRRPSEGSDRRFVIVEVTDRNIQNELKERGTSLSDTSLNRLLTKLEADRPRVIGLDIYRDYPSKLPGLAGRLRQNDRLFALCKVDETNRQGKGVEAGTGRPAEIPLARVGFSDVIADADGVVRRHLLLQDRVGNSQCDSQYAFSLLLAKQYLTLEPNPNPRLKAPLPTAASLGGDELRLGSRVLPALRSFTGGYQGEDAHGYQILLNYRAVADPLQGPFERIPLDQVLNNLVPPKTFADKIVLIGVTSKSSVKDYIATPYGSGNEEVPGVIVQAHMVSQLISAVLNHRPLLWAWPQWAEALWILGWSFVGGLLAWRFQRLPILGTAIAVVIVGLTGICFGCVTQAGWLPLVPAALSLVGTSGILVYIAFRRPYRRSAVTAQAAETATSGSANRML